MVFRLIKSLARCVVPATLWASFRRRRGARHLREYPTRVVEHTYHNFRLKVALRDGLAEGWYDHDWPVQKEIAFLQKLSLKDRATVFDCGAHQGVVALILAAIAGPRGRVIAVEALGHNVAVAEENASLNPAYRPQLTVLRSALAREDGVINFTEDFSQNGQIVTKDNTRSGHQAVPAVTLSSLRSRFGQPDVVFIDIEGAEHAALLGATDLLADAKKPDWFIEVHGGLGLEVLGGSVDAIFQILLDHGYDLYWADTGDGPFRPTTAERPSGHFYLIATHPERRAGATSDGSTTTHG